MLYVRIFKYLLNISQVYQGERIVSENLKEKWIDHGDINENGSFLFFKFE